MAGEWLKFDANTPEKPEVFAITAKMGWDDPDLTVGKLLRIWRWFDQHTIDGNAPSVTLALLDRVAGVSGFAFAMCEAGWLIETESGLQLPNFSRHNGKTAKDRVLTAKRVAAHKIKEQKTNAQGNAPSVSSSVSGALPRTRTRTRTRTREEEVKVRNTKGREISKSTENTAMSPNGDVGVVFAYWKEIHGHPKARLDDKRKRLLAHALKEYPPEDLKRAIDGCKLSPHHQGKNDKGTVYDDIELICRDSKHIEQFIAYTENGIVQPLDPYDAIARLHESYGKEGKDKPIH